MQSFTKKVVVITGAGSGIGRALALDFAQRGARLALNDYNADTLAETESQCTQAGAEVFSQAFDVSAHAAYSAFAEEVIQHFGAVDIVINNAGVTTSSERMLDDLSMEDIEWVLRINLFGVMYGTRLFLPHLKQRPESALVNISSIFGYVGIPGQTPYCTTKFAVRGLNEALWLELQKTNVRVLSVHPGGIKTNIARNARHAEKNPRMVERFEKHLTPTLPAEAARQIIVGIQQKKRRILIGKDAKRIHFLRKWFPKVIWKAVSKGV